MNSIDNIMTNLDNRLPLGQIIVEILQERFPSNELFLEGNFLILNHKHRFSLREKWGSYLYDPTYIGFKSVLILGSENSWILSHIHVI